MSLSASFKTLSGNATIVSIGGEPAIRSQLFRAVVQRVQSFLNSYDDPNSISPMEGALKRCSHLAPNVASLFQNLFTPVAMFFNSKELKEAAIAATLFSDNPREQNKHLGKLLMALLDSGVSVGALAAPLLMGSAGNILLAARAGSAIAESLTLFKHGEARETVLSNFTSKIASNPALSKVLKFIAAKITEASTKTKVSVTNMKLSGTSEETKQHFDEFYQGYKAAYPEAQRESKENMLKYLAEGDQWNVHLIKVDGQLVGGFTTFLVQTKDGKKHLMVEQIFSKNPENAWEVVRAYADSIGADSMWHEVQMNENPPLGFSKVHAPHGQPALLDQEVGDDSLVMTCWFKDPRTTIKAQDYRDIVLKGWLGSWAHPDDPILKKLCAEIPTQGLIAIGKTERGFSLPSLEYDHQLIEKMAKRLDIKTEAYGLSLRELASKDPALAHQIVNELYPGFLESFPFESQQSSLEQMYSYLDQNRSSGTDLYVIFTQSPEGKFVFAAAHATTSLRHTDGSDVGFILYTWIDERMRGQKFGSELTDAIEDYFREMGITKIACEVNDPIKMSKREKEYDTRFSAPPEKRERFYEKNGYKKLDVFYEQGAIQEGGKPCKFLSIWVKGFESVTVQDYDNLIRELYLGGEEWDKSALDVVRKIRAQTSRQYGDDPSKQIRIIAGSKEDQKPAAAIS